MGIKITDSKKLEELKRINKTIIHGDEMDSFPKQLLYLQDGRYDVSMPMIINPYSDNVSYIKTIDSTRPMTITVNTIMKLKHKHRIGFSLFQDVEDMLRDSVLAFDSYQFDDSKIILHDKVNGEELELDSNDLITVIRTDKQHNLLEVNEIASMYNKNNIESFLVRTYENDCRFYKNEKTEQYIKSAELQLLMEMKYALSTNYNRQSFTKSQVEADIGSCKMKREK